MTNDASLVIYNNQSFYEKHVIWADSNFFTVFSFPLLRGNPATCLNNPNGIVLTETTAKKYFGNEDPMGKIVEINKTLKVVVTGIAKDVPPNSTLHFNFALSLNWFTDKAWMNVWTNNPDFIYVVLDEHANKANIEKRFPAFMEKYMGNEMRKMGFHFFLSLVPLRDIYFENASAFDNVSHGDKKVVYIFLSVAVLILLIACINFMNLSTIRAVERSREIGVRKVMGALGRTLTTQFLGESFLLAIISCVLSIGLLLLLMPAFNNLLGYELSVPYTSWWLYAFLGGAAIAVGLLAGSYPALILSRFSPVEALKGKLRLGKGGGFFRQVLVVVQFSISVFLITGTIIIVKQMSYIKNKELGYDQEQTLVVGVADNGDINSNMDVFRQSLRNNTNISSVCLMSGIPGGYFDLYAFEVEGQDYKWQARTEFTDFEFAKTLGLKIIAGRDLSSQYPTDTLSAVLINRAAAASLGLTPQTAIGKWIRNAIMDSARRRIVGVVEDFNYTSLKQNIEPLVISPNPGRQVALIKLNSYNLAKGIEAVKDAYAAGRPGISI